MAQIQIFSETWFEMIKQANSKIGDLHLSPAMKEIRLNFVITPSPVNESITKDSMTDSNNEIKDKNNRGGHIEETVKLYLLEGCLHQGELDDAKTTMSLDYQAMQSLMTSLNMNDAMQCFINGEIQVTGDMSQLMSLQMAKASDEQKLLFKTIVENTMV